MKHPRTLKIADYTYTLPEDRIAGQPSPKRDGSKLLQYKSGTITNHSFVELPLLLPEGSMLVLNETKVVQARLFFSKGAGKAIEVFCLEPAEGYANVHAALQERGQVLWYCMVGGAAKWKEHVVLSISDEDTGIQLSARIIIRTPGRFLLQFNWNKEETSFADILELFGKIPLPPYLHRDADAVDKYRYQTTFARWEGSVAAPTAALHFSPEVFAALNEKNIFTLFTTLHVGAGTFRPVKSETMQDHDMHAEYLELDAAFIKSLIDHQGSPLFAVGTTSLRTLESIYWIGCKLAAGVPLNFEEVVVSQWDVYDGNIPVVPVGTALKALLDAMSVLQVTRLSTRTRIIIAPGYEIKMVDGIVTNFHQPQSTLLLLVAALMGEDWRYVYKHALDNDYRFLSYGDSSLLWRKSSDKT